MHNIFKPFRSVPIITTKNSNMRQFVNFFNEALKDFEIIIEFSFSNVLQILLPNI